ncbi:MAG: sugar ABC transporter permease [Gemmatimonadetes bacterium]|jgi:multiple sugar transport system permease protein|nr:sugar ABC transporter permease [Gemmatimonadota bacterium]MBT7862438.1 sugar ABC transporter permease [Gemmatimonadota bacterium]
MMSETKRPAFDRNWPTAAGFLAPNFVGFLCFTLFPVVLSLVMAFHHWTLRPHEAVRFVGLRNFIDLVGVRAVEEGAAGVLSLYVLCVLGLVASLVGLLLSNVHAWRGARVGGVLIGMTGIVIVAVSLASGDGATSFWYVEVAQGSLLAGMLAVIVGGLVASRDSLEWETGPGLLPGALLTLCVFGLFMLDASMWAAYEPRDGRFWYYLYNTLYMMMGLPLAIVGALSLALLLNEELPLGTWRSRTIGAGACGGLAIVCVILGFGLDWPNVGVLAGIIWVFAGLGFQFNIVTFRTIFYLPQFTSGVAVYVLWKSLYRPETGPINQGLESLFTTLGLALVPPSWLAEIAWAKPAIVAMGVWIFIGGQNMLLYLAALSNVPLELIDAANVDGAGRWQRFRHVTWPQLAPTTFFISIVSVIGGLQGGFEQARVMTEGGPAGSTTALSYYIYNKMFGDLDMGYAAAISWVLFAVIFLATALNWRFGRSQEVDY